MVSPTDQIRVPKHLLVFTVLSTSVIGESAVTLTQWSGTGNLKRVERNWRLEAAVFEKPMSGSPKRNLRVYFATLPL